MSTILTWTRTDSAVFDGSMSSSTAPAPLGSLAPPSSRAGAGMTLASMLSVQIGIAVSVGLAETLGAQGAAWLRLAAGGVLILVLVRPRRTRFTRSSLRSSVALGVTIAAVTMLFMAAVTRLPMGTASALEFLGPLGVAVVRGRRGTRVWPVLAAAGVLLLTRPWSGETDPVGVAYALSAAACWAAYILLSQRVGDTVEGITGLAVALPVAGIVSTLVVAPGGLPELSGSLLLTGVGVALLLPLLPFTLEMLALRRLSAAAFGTLMALEPAFALLVGLVLLGQVPDWPAVVGIGFVVVAGAGAERTGARSAPPTGPPG